MEGVVTGSRVVVVDSSLDIVGRIVEVEVDKVQVTSSG